MNRSSAFGHVLALAVSLVWGTTYISTKVLLTALQPAEILILRFTLAWVVLFVCSPMPLIPKSFRSELPFLGCALTGLTLYYMLENYALKFSMASTVGLVISSAPMFAALLLWLFRRSEKPRLSFYVGFILSMGGIALISLAEGKSFDFNPIGIPLSLGSAICWGGYGVCLEFAQRQGYSELHTTRKIFFWGILFTLPFSLADHRGLELSLFANPILLGNILYLGIGASALCFLAWNRATILIGSVATNVYLYLMPVITVGASAWILREPVTILTVTAIALVLAGLWLSQHKSARVNA